MLTTNEEGRKVLRMRMRRLVGLTAGDVFAVLVLVIVGAVIVWALINFFSASALLIRG